MGHTEGPPPEEVIAHTPLVLAALGDLLDGGACEIPSVDLDIFCIATLNLLAQLAEEYAELAEISPAELVQLLATKLFTDPRQAREPKSL